jgi:hypothetical protein
VRIKIFILVLVYFFSTGTSCLTEKDQRKLAKDHFDGNVVLFKSNNKEVCGTGQPDFSYCGAFYENGQHYIGRGSAEIRIQIVRFFKTDYKALEYTHQQVGL